MQYETILVETEGRVAQVTLNRPEAMNALNAKLKTELLDALGHLDRDDNIGAIVLTGSPKAFAAGADIKEMQSLSYMDAYLGEQFSGWDDVAKTRTPIIAAVAGYALGGGCELAMMCDFILAADNAHFGQPEVKLGVIPGLGGSQRLTRLVGKSKAMEMCLTGRMMDAQEAERAGLVSRVIAAEQLLDDAMDTARRIASFSRPSVTMIKDCINLAYETSLEEGLRAERRLFFSSFALEDQSEGMQAFVDKRKPEWQHR
jgi:enoyl-CoA hydratase